MKQTAKSHLHLIIFHIQHPGQTYSMPFDKCHTNGLRQQLLQAHEKFDDSETKEEKKRAREKTGNKWFLHWNGCVRANLVHYQNKVCEIL